MNRSRQMGGARQALADHERELLDAADRAADDAELVDLAATRQATPARYQSGSPVNQVQATQRAEDASRMVSLGVTTQQALCDSIKGAISSLIRRVKDCDTVNELDLTDLVRFLEDILNNVVRLQGHCVGLGDLLIMLEQKLIDAGCLNRDVDGTFNARVTSIDPAHAAGRQQAGEVRPVGGQAGGPPRQPVALGPQIEPRGQDEQQRPVARADAGAAGGREVAAPPAAATAAQPLNPQSVPKAAQWPEPEPEPEPKPEPMAARGPGGN